MKTIYIRYGAAISIQHPFSSDAIWAPLRYDESFVRCIEPLYKDYIPPMSSRRMSPIIKRAIATALKCVDSTGIEQPDAIIMGTGLGCISDTEKFLNAMIEEGEQYLQPSSFIQSTHNTIGSQIAIRLKCHSFNNTHVQKSYSFESALYEAWLLFALNNIHTALIGGHDEMTSTCYPIIKKVAVGVPLSSEGSTCFMLSDQQPEGKSVAIENVAMGYEPGNIHQSISDFLNRVHLTWNDIDAVITGKNGDKECDAVYDTVLEDIPLPSFYYKSLCGEYPTASAFGLYAAYVCLLYRKIPAVMSIGNIGPKSATRILLLHYDTKYYSLILLSSCGN